jgi:hypothetical protein
MDSELNYDNILKFHYDLFKNIISKTNKKDSLNINFYTLFSSLDTNETKKLFDNIFKDLKIE